MSLLTVPTSSVVLYMVTVWISQFCGSYGLVCCEMLAYCSTVHGDSADYPSSVVALGLHCEQLLPSAPCQQFCFVQAQVWVGVVMGPVSVLSAVPVALPHSVKTMQM